MREKTPYSLEHGIPSSEELYKNKIDWKRIKKYGLPAAIAGLGASIFFRC